MCNLNMPESAHSAHLNREGILCATAERRSMSLISSTPELARIGQPLPLLVEVIQACGDDDECLIQLHETAAKLDISHSTLKTWLRRLDTLRLVSRKPAGKQGVRIRLHTEALPRLQMHADLLHQIGNFKETIQAFRTLANNACDGALGQLGRIIAKQ